MRVTIHMTNGATRVRGDVNVRDATMIDIFTDAYFDAVTCRLADAVVIEGDLVNNEAELRNIMGAEMSPDADEAASMIPLAVDANP